ncbi:hypothetical protein BKA82DRAFT_165596, partial [Pisolithus tinctorius]
CVLVSSHFFHIKKLFDETGDVVRPASATHSHPRVFNHDDLSYLLLHLTEVKT